MASAATSRAPVTAGKPSTVSVKPPSSQSFKVSYNPAGLTDEEVQKLLKCDIKTLQAALVIRRWIKKRMLERKERKLAAQIAHLQQQQELMLTNPQHFQDCELMSLVQLSPLYAPQTRTDVDSFRLLAETTDALLRSEIKKYSHIASKMMEGASSNDLNQRLQLIESGRREILQVYALRVKASQAPLPQPAPKPSTQENITTSSYSTSLSKSKAFDNFKDKENDNKQNRHSVRFSADCNDDTASKPSKEMESKSSKSRRRRSLSWADSSGQHLTISQFFESDAIVAPGRGLMAAKSVAMSSFGSSK
jgi:hypothetical protein